MPRLSKEAISQFIRTGCDRQLRLILSPDNRLYRDEREAQGMPPPQPPRPGLAEVRRLGDEWQAAKLHDLTETFGADAIVGDLQVDERGRHRFRSAALGTLLFTAKAGQFIIEGEYEIGDAFKKSLAITRYREVFDLDYAAARPDIIAVLEPGHFSRRVSSSGNVELLPTGDPRLQLRVIDIKLTAEPSPGYFAETAYYAMTLAGWLDDQGLADEFVVVPDCAIWPGSHEAAHLTVTHRSLLDQGYEPTVQQLRAAMEEDLEPIPLEVFVFRLRHFLQRTLPRVLDRPWNELDWHVDNRCKGCEYLGYPWTNAEGQRTDDELHCMPTALRQGHLSRIAFISRGSRSALHEAGVQDTATLSQRTALDPAFDTHQQLRATRTVVAGRAIALEQQRAHIPSESGTSSVMPRWADLRIYVMADFDIGSAITFAFGLKAFWIEPQSYGASQATQSATRSWEQVFTVDQRDLAAEQRETLAFLDEIHKILNKAHDLNPETTVQFYLWDSLQFDHLARVIGRHLDAILADRTIDYLAWLFPPEEVLPDPRASSRESPITIVREVVRSILAAPVPHYYSLLETARAYHLDSLPPQVAKFSIHPLFEDVLSDQIPSERAHEIWARSTTPRHWASQLGVLRETVEKRLAALEAVTRRLESELRGVLGQGAPRITRISPPQRVARLSFDGQLWYAFAKLNNALDQLETYQVRAMPPHEREARLRSVRLDHRLVGEEKQRALAQLGIPSRPRRRVYKMARNSREVKLREGDFNIALAPGGESGFLDQSLDRITQGTPLQPTDDRERFRRLEEVTAVTVVAIDRDELLIAFDPNNRWPTMIDDLESEGLADFSTNAILDPVHHDFFTKKLRDALTAIGNPQEARDNPLVRRATGQLTARGSRRTDSTPAAEALWSAQAMHSTRVQRELSEVPAALKASGLDLNETQWQAWEAALSRRLQLIWGPPGTGKSRTVRAVVVGAALEAHQTAKPIRILICASTYTAMDNVLLPVYQDIRPLLPEHAYQVYRVRSYLRAPEPQIPVEIDVELNRYSPTPSVSELHFRLRSCAGISIVGATPEQVYNLIRSNHDVAHEELFDIIVLDEASQMDVAHAVLPLCSLARGGSVILAGDPKQLPPIHQATPPVGLESMVGSIYTFYDEGHGVPPVMLDQNYRSNRTLVEFSRSAGYEETLTSYSPDLKLRLVSPIPTERPDDWPNSLYWTREWSTLLDPDLPAVCFVYDDWRSSQWNQFEADAVAALVTLYAGRLACRLEGERDPSTGALLEVTNASYSPVAFWEQAVGVVTPHRAQQGLIINRLQQIFVPRGIAPGSIREAVDTVERFQGQQRDVIIASFALGDPDIIQDEDEFLMSLNRFNVMASRARAKLIVLVTQQVIDHLSSDLETLRESTLLKTYPESFCSNSRSMTLGVIDDSGSRPVVGLFKYRRAGDY